MKLEEMFENLFEKKRLDNGKNFSLWVGNCRVFCGNISKYSWWFRVFGRGISCRNGNVWGLRFSERNGYSKYMRIGKWIIHKI